MGDTEGRRHASGEKNKRKVSDVAFPVQRIFFFLSEKAAHTNAISNATNTIYNHHHHIGVVLLVRHDA